MDTEKQQHRLLRFYEMAQRLGNVGHWYWKIGDPRVEWSPETCRIHGVAVENSKPTLEEAVAFYLEDDRTLVSNGLETSIAELCGFAFEARIRRTDGEVRNVKSVGECELDDQGLLIALFGVFCDITEQRMAEKRLDDALKRQIDFAEVSSDWLWEMGPDLRFTYMSPQVERVTGVPANFHMGKTRRELMDGKDISPEMEMHFSWCEQHKPFRDFRYWRVGHDGRRQYMSASGIPFFDENGEFQGYRGSGRDITAQEEAKLELLQANRKLHSANRAKSDALSSLKEANALLEDQNEALSEVKNAVMHAALHDSMTGIANRRYLDERLAQISEQRADGPRKLSVLHIDLDRFKQINDTLGHAAGDAVLVHVAGILANLADGDFVARVGGDEFVVLSTQHVTEGAAGALAQRVIDACAKPFYFEERACWFGASIGIAIDEVEAGKDCILVNADIALYRAKMLGRGRYAFFDDALQAEIVRYKHVADGILAGLSRGEFVPWFQPQVSSWTMEIIGFEALARWEHPKEGVLKPADFLAVAEDLNTVAEIDRVILERALECHQDWRALGLCPGKLSVNVSAKRLMKETLIHSLRGIDIPPRSLVFELLESVFLDEIDDQIAWNIDTLKSMGIEIALDDFGSGHASVVSLIQLAPQIIKLDRQLIAGICDDPSHCSLVRSMVDIGRSLNVKVVAEGVENIDQAHVLRGIGCDALQGFFASQPIPATEVPAFFELWETRRKDFSQETLHEVGL